MIGMQAAKAAGMRCIVTKSRYTEGESFDAADAVFDCIGDAGDERFSLEGLCTPGTHSSPLQVTSTKLHSFQELRAAPLMMGTWGLCWGVQTIDAIMEELSR